MKKKPLMEREELNHAGIEVRIKIAHLKQNKAKVTRKSLFTKRRHNYFLELLQEDFVVTMSKNFNRKLK